MLHTKNYFSFFGMLASTINVQLQSLFSLLASLKRFVLPNLNQQQLRITTAVNNQTKIQR